MIKIINKNDFYLYIENIIDVSCQQLTRQYIIQNLAALNRKDFSKNSVTLLYANAIESYDFNQFQTLADYLFYTKSFYPKYLKFANEDYYNQLAKKSYYSCYKIIKQWLIFEELADKFESLTEEVRLSFELQKA